MKNRLLNKVFLILVNVPPIPPLQAGHCMQSKLSGREICYPIYEDLDTTCTDAGNGRSGLVAPPVIPHATLVFIL